MQTYLFDDNGDVRDAKSRRLAEVLQASIGGDELLNYVIRNLGFVGISEASVRRIWRAHIDPRAQRAGEIPHGDCRLIGVRQTV